MKIIPYNKHSLSAKALAQAIPTKRIRHHGKPIHVPLLINWGMSRLPDRVTYGKILNPPDAIAKAVNKLQAFKAMSGHCPIPEFTEELVEAKKWLAEGFDIVARHTLTGCGGAGIQIHSHKEEFVDERVAPMYVKYIHKKHEYRIHVVLGKVIFVQRKAAKKGVDNINYQVRNHANGFIFAHKDVDVDNRAKEAAIMAVNALGLHFGAVDIIHNVKHDKFYVLEVNTACGLSGETLNKYVEVFKNVGDKLAVLQ